MKEDIREYEQDTESLPVLLVYTFIVLVVIGCAALGTFLFG